MFGFLSIFLPRSFLPVDVQLYRRGISELMNFLIASWQVLCELAPWLLLGMLLSGLMHAFLPANFIRRNLAGASGVFKSVLLGVPLPLCSCGVVPTGIGLKNQGASDGASVGFLISTPQTGVDSILVSASFFGWPFAIFKMVLAAVTGVVGGLLTGTESEKQNSVASLSVLQPDSGAVNAPDEVAQPWWRRAWEHGNEILESIWGWLVIGVLISAAISVLVPRHWLAGVAGLGIWPAMFLMLLFSLPLYVCATASVPIAAALVQGGLPPAAALVFLMAGPATNVATIGAIRGRFGGRVTIVYLLTIVVGSMLGAWLFYFLIDSNIRRSAIHNHNHLSWFSQASAGLLVLLMARYAWNLLEKRFLRTTISDEDSITIGVDGMHCGSCVSRLVSALKKQDGVTAVEVQLDPGMATIVGDATKRELESAITDAGFTIRE